MASCTHGKDRSSIDTLCLLCLLEGELAAQEGQARALQSQAGKAWMAKAMPVALQLAAAGKPFSSEHITAQVGMPRSARTPGSNSAVGALIGALSRQGLITLVGAVKASDPISHAAQLGLWVGTEKADQEW